MVSEDKIMEVIGKNAYSGSSLSNFLKSYTHFFHKFTEPGNYLSSPQNVLVVLPAIRTGNRCTNWVTEEKHFFVFIEFEFAPRLMINLRCNHQDSWQYRQNQAFNLNIFFPNYLNEVGCSIRGKLLKPDQLEIP